MEDSPGHQRPLLAGHTPSSGSKDVPRHRQAALAVGQGRDKRPPTGLTHVANIHPGDFSDPPQASFLSRETVLKLVTGSCQMHSPFGCHASEMQGQRDVVLRLCSRVHLVRRGGNKGVQPRQTVSASNQPKTAKLLARITHALANATIPSSNEAKGNAISVELVAARVAEPSLFFCRFSSWQARGPAWCAGHAEGQVHGGPPRPGRPQDPSADRLRVPWGAQLSGCRGPTGVP